MPCSGSILVGGMVADASPPQRTDRPARRPWPVPRGLAGTTIAVGLIAAPWAWYTAMPAMYIAGCVLAALGVGLLVATHLTVTGNVTRAVLGASLVVVITVGAMFVPGWRPSAATDHATVWRVGVSDHDSLVAVPTGNTLWVFDDTTIRVVDRDTGNVRARIDVPRSEEVRRTSWGIAVRHWHEGGRDDSVAGYRTDGTRAWRFTDPRRGDLELRATRDGVTAVVACRDWEEEGPTPKTCRATGLDASGKRVWTRRVSKDAAAAERLGDAHLLLSRKHKRWHFVDPKTGHDLAAPAPKGLVHPWVTGDLAVFTRSGEGDACDIVAYRDGRRAWQHRMRGSACESGPDARLGWALYDRAPKAQEDDSYIVDARRQSVDKFPDDLPGEHWIGYRHGVLVSKSRPDKETTAYGTDLDTGRRRWSRTSEGLVLGNVGAVAVFDDEWRPLSGDDYSPDARVATVYAPVSGHRISSARVAEGAPDDLTSVGNGAVLLWYDDHVTYVAPR